MFRALVVNPRETFTDVTSPAAWQLALSVGRIGYCTCQSNQSKNPWFVSLPSSSTFGGKAIQRGILQVWIILAPPWDAARPLPGQVLAHWIAICRWHHGGPQSGYPVLSNSLQIVSISEVVTMILPAVACSGLESGKFVAQDDHPNARASAEALLCGQHAFTGRHAGFEGGPKLHENATILLPNNACGWVARCCRIRLHISFADGSVLTPE